MNRRIATVLFTFILPLLAHAQPTEVAMANVKKLLQAVSTGDADTVVNLTNGKLHQMLGGREKMIATLTETFRSAQRAGHKLNQFSVGQPSPLGRDGKQIFLFIPYVGTFSNNEIRLLSRPST